MNLFTALLTVIKLWLSYGSVATTAMKIINELGELNGGTFFDDIHDVFKANGIDIPAMVAMMTAAGASASADLTTIKGIQTAINAIGANPQLTINGQFDGNTVDAIKAYQRQFNQNQTGVPDADFCAALTRSLPKP